MTCDNIECNATIAIAITVLQCILGAYILYKCPPKMLNYRRRIDADTIDVYEQGDVSVIEEEPRAYMRKIRSHDKIEHVVAT